jgi:hypothetical protein
VLLPGEEIEDQFVRSPKVISKNLSRFAELMPVIISLSAGNALRPVAPAAKISEQGADEHPERATVFTRNVVLAICSRISSAHHNRWWMR